MCICCADSSLSALKQKNLVPFSTSIETLSELYGKDVHVFLHILRFALRTIRLPLTSLYSSVHRSSTLRAQCFSWQWRQPAAHKWA
jgi:hypothetical protein